ncbi:MAG TPA: hypothetical protein VH496_15520 [Mycobacterium sp.]|jgi:hypothetical protein
MTAQPEQIRAEISALLAELPEVGQDVDLAGLDIDALAGRLEEAHDVLVRALESVEG